MYFFLRLSIHHMQWEHIILFVHYEQVIRLEHGPRADTDNKLVKLGFGPNQLMAAIFLISSRLHRPPSLFNLRLPSKNDYSFKDYQNVIMLIKRYNYQNYYHQYCQLSKQFLICFHHVQCFGLVNQIDLIQCFKNVLFIYLIFDSLLLTTSVLAGSMYGFAFSRVFSLKSIINGIKQSTVSSFWHYCTFCDQNIRSKKKYTSTDSGDPSYLMIKRLDFDIQQREIISLCFCS